MNLQQWVRINGVWHVKQELPKGEHYTMGKSCLCRFVEGACSVVLLSSHLRTGDPICEDCIRWLLSFERAGP